MGFIEDLRRKKREEEKSKEHARLLQQESDKRKQLLQDEEKANRKALHDRSKQMFEESGLMELIGELGKLGGYEGVYNVDFYNGKLREDVDSYACMIAISNRRIGDMQQSKYFVMVADAGGTIKFKAGLFGSSTVGRSVWQQDRNVLENALGKAYHNPRVRRYPYESPRIER